MTAKKIAIWLVVAVISHFLLMIFWFLPMYLIQPKSLRSPIYNVSQSLASVFRDFSELQLESGTTCNQFQTVCLDSFILEGDIQPGDGEIFTSKIRELIVKYPKVKLICLNSEGGFTAEAAIIAKRIRELKLDTCVGDLPLSNKQMRQAGLRFTASCKSACNLILLAGTRRVAIGDRFVLGLHASKRLYEQQEKGKEAPVALSARAAGTPTSFTSKIAREDVRKQFGTTLQVSDLQLEKIFDESARTPGSRMYSTSPKEQMELGFFTERMGSTLHDE